MLPWSIRANIAFIITYVVTSSICFLVDTYSTRAKDFKIQKKKDIPDITNHEIRVVLVNLLILGPAYCFLWEKSGVLTFTDDMPGFSDFVHDLLAFAVISDVVMYSSHRIFHLPPLYSYFHKQHHKFKNPVAFFSIYCSVVEHLFINLHSCLIPLCYIGCGPSACLLMTVVAVDTCLAHSGYSRFAEHHDAHHEFFNRNFGTSFGMMDRIFGTCGKTSNKKPTSIFTQATKLLN